MTVIRGVQMQRRPWSARQPFACSMSTCVMPPGTAGMAPLSTAARISGIISAPKIMADIRSRVAPVFAAALGVVEASAADSVIAWVAGLAVIAVVSAAVPGGAVEDRKST